MMVMVFICFMMLIVLTVVVTTRQYITIIDIGVVISTLVSSYLCMRRWTCIAHGDVWSPGDRLPKWAVLWCIFVACVSVRRGSILSVGICSLVWRWQEWISSLLFIVLFVLLGFPQFSLKCIFLLFLCLSLIIVCPFIILFTNSNSIIRPISFNFFLKVTVFTPPGRIDKWV